jgi:hypothetical protein
MVKHICSTQQVVLLLILFIVLSGSDCGGGGVSNVGYHCIPIAGYEEGDYVVMLDDQNPEMQYNALCLLGTFGNSYHSTLDSLSLKGTPHYDSALMVYEKIFSLMSSKDDWVSSAAIRAMSLFNYDRKRITRAWLQDERPSRNIQLEIINSISKDTILEEELIMKKMNFLSNSHSWLLRNSSIFLASRFSKRPNARLMGEYRNATAEYQQLNVLANMSDDFPDSIFHFLSREWASTSNPKIKKAIIRLMDDPKNKSRFLHWLLVNNLNTDEYFNDLSILELYHESPENPEVVSIIRSKLNAGWKSAMKIEMGNGFYDEEVPLLYHYLFIEKYPESDSTFSGFNQSVAGNKLEKWLLDYPKLAREWRAYEKDHKIYPLPKNFIQERDRLVDQYIAQYRYLFTKHGIDTLTTVVYLKNLGNLEKTMKPENKLRN